MAVAPDQAVLVVEDDPLIRELMVEVLTDGGFRVEVASDGLEAVQLLERDQRPPRHRCAVLLDMMLPRLDGLTVMRRIRALGENVPIIALSASREHLAQAMLQGATLAVAKPFDVEHVLAAVAAHCRQAH